jgi:ketosteroid isomerase-like protein
MPAPNEACLDEHLAAENAHDVDRIMATYCEAPVIVLNGKRIEGTAAVRAFHENFGFGGAGSFSRVRVDERARHHSDGAIVLEQTLRGVHSGAWMSLAATGREFSVDVCTVYFFDDAGKLAAEHVYMDLLRIQKQLATI